MMSKVRVLTGAVLLAIGMLVTVVGAPSASADDTGVGGGGEFLCPIVGDGVLIADVSNGDNGVSTIAPAPGVSLLPGHNQAGNHANSNALNDSPPNDPNAGPGGGNSGFGAIWPVGG